MSRAVVYIKDGQVSSILMEPGAEVLVLDLDCKHEPDPPEARREPHIVCVRHPLGRLRVLATVRADHDYMVREGAVRAAFKVAGRG